MNNKIKLIGFGAMILSFIAMAISGWTQEQEIKEAVKEEVQNALSKNEEDE